MNESRYAIYYAPPPESPLWAFGSGVLGYDAATGEARPHLTPEGVSPAEFAVMTAQPRRYGFHATLKAPFRLAEGVTEDDVVEAGHAFSRHLKAFELPPLEVGALDGFVALIARSISPELDVLAAECVEAFEPFRRPLDAAETARRVPAALTPRQRAALDRWGYPFVFEDFRFHMTLTGSLTASDAAKVAPGLARLYEAYVGAASTRVDAVTLYVEDAPEHGFRIVDRFVFGAG